MNAFNLTKLRKEVTEKKYIVLKNVVDLRSDSDNIRELKNSVTVATPIFQTFEYDTTTNVLSEGSNDNKRKQLVLPYEKQNSFLRRLSDRVSEIVNTIFPANPRKSKLPALVQSPVSVLYSEPGCEQQDLHFDYDPTKIDTWNCYGCIIFLENNSSLVLSNMFGTKLEYPIFSAGDIIIFRGDKCHAGASYAINDNVRLHYYFDRDGYKRVDDATYPAKAYMNILKEFYSIQIKRDRSNKRCKKIASIHRESLKVAMVKKYRL